MTENILIHQASPADIPRFEKLAEAQNSRKEPDYFARCLLEQAEGKRLMFIATLDGADAGYGMLNRQPQYALYRRLSIPEIQDLNVVSDYRRRGVATALITRFEALARLEKHDHIGISVGLYPDYGAAQRLYVRLGYVPDGYGVTYDRETVKPGEVRPVDDNLCLMMVKELKA